MYRLLGSTAFLILCFFSLVANAVPRGDSTASQREIKSEESFEASHFLFLPNDSIERAEKRSYQSYSKPKKRKLKATLLSIFLGHFGVHRIYLGTSANVPVAYSLTLGGGLGLLPLIDTIAILSSNDLDEFANNDRVIMWSKPKAK